jgi:hypothetical protein
VAPVILRVSHLLLSGQPRNLLVLFFPLISTDKAEFAASYEIYHT